MSTDSTEEQAVPAVVSRIPRLVKRNTILLALSQALAGAGTQMIPALGPLLSIELIGSAAFAGAAVSITGVSRFAIAYPIGKIMDVYGRRAGLLLGMVIAIVGTSLTGVSVIQHSFPLFILGLFIFGLGVGATQQIRLAAADMYPPSRRAEGLGYVLTGSLVGALGGPVIISVGQFLSPGLGLSPLATPWLVVPLLILPSLVLVSAVRPDPKEIAAHLDRYYPGYKAPASTAVVHKGGGRVGAILGHYPKLVAIVASAGALGTMSMVMAMTSLALAQHGHDLPSISVSISIHVIGMYALSLPLGKLSDAIGRRYVLALGSLVVIVGSLLVTASPQYWVITLGTFLVGVGWSCVNVASTAVLTDTARPHERGRAIGVSDAFANLSGIVLPLVAGPLLDNFGLNSVGALGAVVMVPPLLMLIRLREPAPGKYEDARAVSQQAR